MCIISTVANYGGKVSDNKQDVKQFYFYFIYLFLIRLFLLALIVGTPSDNSKPILINNLIITGSISNTSDFNLHLLTFQTPIIYRQFYK